VTEAALSRPQSTSSVAGVLRYALLLVLCLGLYLPGQFDLPPVDRDEARFAQASHQMLESGDFVSIRFQNEARNKKPVGIYWLQAASVGLLSPDDLSAIWAYRVPSWVGATLAVLLTAWAGSALFGAEAGFLAALMLAGTVLLGVEARMAKTDAVLLAVIMGAQAALARLYMERDRSEAPGRALWLIFWTAQGIGVLIKGPIVPMVSGLTLLALWAFDRRMAWARRLRPLKGVAIVAAIAAPWLILIAIATNGAFFVEAVGHDMLGKVAGGQESHGQPPGFYILSFWLTFAPWAFLAVLAAPWVWANRHEAAVRFCVAWIVPTWIMFEAVPTKLPHYVLPTFPAIAMLIAAALLGGATGTAETPRRRLWVGALVPAALFALALPVAVAVLPVVAAGRFDPLAALAGVVGLAGLCGGLWLMRRGRITPAIAATLATMLLLYGVTFQRVFPELEPVWLSRQVADAVKAGKPCGDTVLASAGYTEPSLVFLVGTGTRLSGSGEVAARHLLSDPACGLALVESRLEEAFRQGLGQAQPRLADLRTFTGFNYSRGKTQTLTLYALRP